MIHFPAQLLMIFGVLIADFSLPQIFFADTVEKLPSWLQTSRLTRS